MESSVVERGRSKAMACGRSSLWQETEREEQGVCGHVKSAAIEQEIQVFFRGRKNTKATQWEVLVFYDTNMSSTIKIPLIFKQK